MSSIANRLREFRAAVGLTQREVADLCGLGKRTIIYWEMGDREIKCSKLIPLVNEYDLDFNWLILGRGKMFNVSLSADVEPVSEEVTDEDYEIISDTLATIESSLTESQVETEEVDLESTTPEPAVESVFAEDDHAEGVKPEQEDVLTLIQRLRRK